MFVLQSDLFRNSVVIMESGDEKDSHGLSRTGCFAMCMDMVFHIREIECTLE
jgi:hypothetical protein